MSSDSISERAEMKCVRCGGFSSARVCWHCSNLPDAVTYAEVDRLKRELATVSMERDKYRDLNDYAEKRVLALAEELEKEGKDGERYRFWRALQIADDDCEAINAVQRHMKEWTADEWDAILDAAMAEPGLQEGR